MEWLSFLGSILGGLIGGLFTFMGVKKTLKSEKAKEEKKEKEELYQKRPRLEVIEKTDYINVKEEDSIYVNNGVIMLKIEKYDVSSRPTFYYDERCLKKTNLCYREFVLKNTGETEIDYLYITTNYPKSTSLFEIRSYEILVKEKILSYDAFGDSRFIKKGDTFTLRIYYLIGEIFYDHISSSIEIWLRDINGNLWGQSLFVNDGYIDNSTTRKSSELREYIDISNALECFRNPYLW